MQILTISSHATSKYCAFCLCFILSLCRNIIVLPAMCQDFTLQQPLTVGYFCCRISLCWQDYCFVFNSFYNKKATRKNLCSVVRALATGRGVVQRVRDMRRASMLGQHHAHVLHQHWQVRKYVLYILHPSSHLLFCKF